MEDIALLEVPTYSWFCLGTPVAFFHRRNFSRTLKWYQESISDGTNQPFAQFFEPDPCYVFVSESGFIELEVLWPASRFLRALQAKDSELECLVRRYGGVETAAICTFLASRKISTPATVIPLKIVHIL